MSLNLLIVESPKKAKTIQKFLPKNWVVKASYGHFRELAKDGENKLGFEIVGNRVICRYVPISSKAIASLKELKQLAKTASKVVLATDPDREGEAISFHLLEELKPKNYQRITYSEITEKAINNAIANPRQLDDNLVGSAIARSCLDKKVGYTLSPLLWSLNIGAKSTGRVQAPTLHIICTREKQIQEFKSEPYWTVWVDYAEGFRAYYHAIESTEQEIEKQRDDTEATEEQKVETTRVGTEAEAQRLLEITRSNPHKIITLKTFTQNKNPPPPFTTSSLQQAAGARLKFNPEKTMQIAQHLFEAGSITYHRTDAYYLSDDFVTAARKYLLQKDPRNLPDKPPQFKSKKNAQFAHEAIRPTDLTKPSAVLKEELDSDHFALYELIWRRAIASQCNPAQIEKTKIISQSGSALWLARGQVIQFLGYGRYWKDFGDNNNLPQMRRGEQLQLLQADSNRKMTDPPPRYSEAKLVQIMERVGIGRPSTYSSTVKTLQQRDYVKVLKGKLVATELGLAVDLFQTKTFPQLVESNFTAEMETSLDAIAQGDLEWQQYFINWSKNSFDPALEKAHSVAASESRNNVKPHYEVSSSYSKKAQISSKTRKSSPKKPKAATKAKSSPTTLLDKNCPVCHSPLAEKSYTKNGETKKMLVCSSNNGDLTHKDIVYFWTSRNQWWSPKLGELEF
ncbi:DNA topoisomerase I (plasmid) [Chondrocystis sp. NIES-4102]|nr:DNA topoisomerase I [Chondrocystis sp. NIES-4102]